MVELVLVMLVVISEDATTNDADDVDGINDVAAGGVARVGVGGGDVCGSGDNSGDATIGLLAGTSFVSDTDNANDVDTGGDADD